MSDDIVTRLRFWSETRNNQPTSWNIDCAQAADEIERLREELRKYTGDGHVPIEPFTPEAL